MTDLPTLPADQLSVVVFGPGFGESIVLCAPPGEWLVVDSLTDRKGRPSSTPGARLLAAHDASPKAVLLTHPHDDHSAGFDQYIDQWPEAMVGCLPFHFTERRDRLTDQDAERALRSGHAEHALAAVLDAWERFPNRVWRVDPLSRMNLGEAVLTVVGPDDRAIDAALGGRRVDPNDLSTPLAVEWESVRLILGADLPARGWERFDSRHPEIAAGDHVALKVPHHGSRAAQPALLGHPDDARTRTWLATPWRLGGGRLPRFEDGEGMDLLLSRVDEVALTALPYALDAHRRGPTATRQEINELIERRRFGGDDIVLTYESPAPSSQDSWIALSYSRSGELTAADSGSAAITVCR